MLHKRTQWQIITGKDQHHSKMCKITFSDRKQIVIWDGEGRDIWEGEPEAIFKGYGSVHYLVCFIDIYICQNLSN